MRVQKFLSAAGCCSRRQGETYIQQGRVRVNGKTVTKLGTTVNPDTDRIELNGKPVRISDERIYVALHKPKGYVTSCRHPGDRTVLELIDLPQRVYPIGRLDKDSTGLLILTNDGALHHRLSHPSFDHEKEYEVKLAGPISDIDLQRMREGMRLQGIQLRPAVIRRLSSTQFRIILKEGRNRQIRRMAEELGNRVVKLKRIRMASVRLGKLPEGGWRYLTTQEIRGLINP